MRRTVSRANEACDPFIYSLRGQSMSINRRDFSKVLLGVAGGVIAGSQLQGCVCGRRGCRAEKHACKGLNSCKGKGGCSAGDGGCAGKNSCKGKGGCATAKHDCKGHNECKGQGGCKTGDNGCAGKNSCKGKGGCKSPREGVQPRRCTPCSRALSALPGGEGWGEGVVDAHTSTAPIAGIFPTSDSEWACSTAHFRHIVEKWPRMDWFEILSENFIDTAGPAALLPRPDRRALSDRDAWRVALDRQHRSARL